MHKIKEMLMKELYEYEDKAKKMNGGKISAGDLETLHKLTDTVKNIGKIEMLEEGGYSEDSRYMGEGRIYGTSYDNGSSYARGRGRNARRDSMGRYSREGGYSEEGYSEEGGSSYAGGGSGGGRGNQGGSRGGTGGRGYSRESAKDHLINKAEEMLEMAQDPRERKAIEKFIRELEDD